MNCAEIVAVDVKLVETVSGGLNEVTFYCTVFCFSRNESVNVPMEVNNTQNQTTCLSPEN